MQRICCYKCCYPTRARPIDSETSRVLNVLPTSRSGRVDSLLSTGIALRRWPVRRPEQLEDVTLLGRSTLAGPPLRPGLFPRRIQRRAFLWHKPRLPVLNRSHPTQSRSHARLCQVSARWLGQGVGLWHRVWHRVRTAVVLMRGWHRTVQHLCPARADGLAGAQQRQGVCPDDDTSKDSCGVVGRMQAAILHWRGAE